MLLRLKLQGTTTHLSSINCLSKHASIEVQTFDEKSYFVSQYFVIFQRRREVHRTPLAAARGASTQLPVSSAQHHPGGGTGGSSLLEAAAGLDPCLVGTGLGPPKSGSQPGQNPRGS